MGEGETRETLSAVIRVLAAGEEDEAIAEMFNNATRAVHSSDVVCMSEAWFVSSIVSLSALCLLLSTLISCWVYSSHTSAKTLPR